MKLKHQDIIVIDKMIKDKNKAIDAENIEARYKSPEEKEFTLGACVGLLSLWKPINGEYHSGLPPEISCIIGDKLSREDAKNIALTCKKANTTGTENRNNYIKESGKSYVVKKQYKSLSNTYGSRTAALAFQFLRENSFEHIDEPIKADTSIRPPKNRRI